jgi:hypothetical protein
MSSAIKDTPLWHLEDFSVKRAAMVKKSKRNVWNIQFGLQKRNLQQGLHQV